jgi:hypothetical protein
MWQMRQPVRMGGSQFQSATELMWDFFETYRAHQRARLQVTRRLRGARSSFPIRSQLAEVVALLRAGVHVRTDVQGTDTLEQGLTEPTIT